MNNPYKLLLSIIAVCYFALPSFAFRPLWSDVNVPVNLTASDRQIIPLKYRLLQLNLDDLKKTLSEVPDEFGPEAKTKRITIEFPLPNGGVSRFYVCRSSIMEQPLADAYPQIQTFACQGIDDPYASARIDYTLKGFHAIVLSPRGCYFIDPYAKTSDAYYISYYQNALASSDAVFCRDEEGKLPSVTGNVKGRYLGKTEEQKATGIAATPAFRTSGAVLRTYRIAIAATGGYSAYHGGTIPLALSAQITSLNRITALFRREFSISFTLIARNTEIIFLNDSTDPFIEPNAAESAHAIDSIIGDSDYDLGHLFFGSGGGSGAAYTGTVCSPKYKGGGLTGSATPIGWNRFEGVWAHELGHQFGAQHTYNGCSGAGSGIAYEPGSGSTIMSYAGGCGADSDLQSSKDPYYHVANFDQVMNFLSTINCGVVTATGNTPPVATVTGTSYTIPFGTPFMLNGSGYDPDGDTLTYCWEQFDLGVASYPLAPSAPGPRFRSYLPKNTPQRIIPDYAHLLAGTMPMGEVLSTGPQSLRFRFTVRDNRSIGGGVGYDSNFCNLTVAAAGPFIVKSPLFMLSGSSNTLEWNVNGTNLGPVSCSNVNITLSIDGGTTFPFTLATNTPNDGFQAVMVPGGINTQQARIKVEAAGNIFFNITSVFTIQTTALPLPTIKSFTAQTGSVYDTVSITGTGFFYITDVSFGGTPASSFKVHSSTNITATIGTGSSGNVTVKNHSGIALKSGFIFTPPSPPVISGFTPTIGFPTAVVNVTGSNFIYITNVRFGGVPAASFTVNSSTSITATIGTGSSGEVSVANLWGTASLGGFLMPGTYAGNYDTIGSGSGVNGPKAVPSPYGNYFSATKHQMIYTAKELTAAGFKAGLITELGFKVSTLMPGVLQDFNLKIGHTQLATLPSTMVTKGMIPVYANIAFNPSIGWNLHRLITPFLWDGTSNIILESCFNNNTLEAIGNTGTVYTTDLPNGICTYYRVTNVPTACSDTASAIPMTGRPNIKLFLIPTPTVPASGIGFSALSSTSVKVSWSSGNGGNRIVVCNPLSVNQKMPENLFDYTADSRYGMGSPLGTQNYVVYKGNGNSVTVTGLSPATTYTFRVVEYNGLPMFNNYETSNIKDSSVTTLSATGVTSLQNNSGKQVHLKPNPASGSFKVMCDASLKQPALIKVLNEQGAEVIQQITTNDETLVAITGLGKGLYVVVVTLGLNTSYHRLVVK